MGKKKAVRRKATAKKTPAARKKKKPTPKKKSPARKKTASRKPAPKRRKPNLVKKPVRSRSVDLGRARVSGTAELDQHFLKDYEARQVFTFLGVKTLKELEGYSPQEIIDLLTSPMVMTVNRIRKALALQNRCLAGDQKFALQFKQQMQSAIRKN